MRTLLIVCIFLVFAVSTFAMSSEGCGAGECNQCHTMSMDEAKAIFPPPYDVVSVDFSEMPGAFVVVVNVQDKQMPLYVDFSKKYLITGNIFRLPEEIKDKSGKIISAKAVTNLSQEDNISTSKRKQVEWAVDPAKIPLDNAIVIGKPEARNKLIVFSDPDCPACKSLHKELNKVVELDPEIAVFVLLFPLVEIHKDAYAKSKSVVCLKSTELLDAAYAGLPIPPATCETDAVDKTIALANELGIQGTPTMIFPDGKPYVGAMPAKDIIAKFRKK